MQTLPIAVLSEPLISVIRLYNGARASESERSQLIYPALIIQAPILYWLYTHTLYPPPCPRKLFPRVPQHSVE